VQPNNATQQRKQTAQTNSTIFGAIDKSIIASTLANTQMIS
jgi:hypothetical protein